jgi:alpha-1,2-mannosyltransferase
MFYSTGLIYRHNPSLIYDYNTQIQTQQGLVAPTVLPGYNPYMNPPFMAPICALLNVVSLNWAIVVWTILAISSVFLTVHWLYKLYAINQKTPVVPFWQLVIIILSFFPFIEGLQSGQNHWLTLLLITGIIYAMVTKKWYLAGILAGILIYKPQFALGFIIIWLIWKNWKALLSFGLVAFAWAGIFLLLHGFDLYRVYLKLSQVFMDLPYIPGFLNYLLVTFDGLLTSIFPQDFQNVLSILSQALLIMCTGGLAWLAYQYRNSSTVERIPVIVAALVVPLLAPPYALLHDMVILVPAYVLWTIYSNSRPGLYASIIIYLGSFFLTFVGALTNIAWVSFLVIGLLICIIVWSISRPKPYWSRA